MARKQADAEPDDTLADLQRPPAEILHKAELERLAAADAGQPRPRGWMLTPASVARFVLGDDRAGIAPKFVGKRSLIERCVVALATNRGLMLIGEPGTAKSFLSELLAAAISGDQRRLDAHHPGQRRHQ